MAQNIGKKRGKSHIETTIENDRRAGNKNPDQRKAFAKNVGTVAEIALNLSSLGPLTKAGKVVKKASKAFKKLTKTVPPKRGPLPQGLKHGGCPFREAGAKSNIQGVKDIQRTGQKFIGVK